MGVWRCAQRIADKGDALSNPAGVFMRAILDETYVTPRTVIRVSAPTTPAHIKFHKPSPEEVERQKQMALAWRRYVVALARDPELRACRDDLKSTCRDPGNPTDAEARSIRDTILEMAAA